MLKWVPLKPEWTLQDVQAGLNVVIAFLCAGGIFVMVRYCWLLAARRVAHQKDVPAYQLLSLNTVGETIDVIWLLRNDILTSRYKGLLLQCIFVMLFTAAALTSGFIARFSTKYGHIVRERATNGTIAERSTGNILYAEVDTNTTLAALQAAKFPQNQLLEYMPNLNYEWEYIPEQWNSSWSMDCTYNKSTPIENPVTTGNCTDFTTEFPQINDNYWDWTDSNWTWYYQNTGWRDTFEEWRDWIIFTHGVHYLEYNEDLQGYTALEMRSVTIYLAGIPWNNSLSSLNCNFAPGPIRSAFYTSCNCKLSWNITGRSKEDLYYAAYPDNSDISTETSAYIEHFGNRFRKESSRHEPVTVISGEELAMFYQAYQITKDTSTSANVLRPINVHLRAPQISTITLIVCSIAAAVVITGLVNYWIFLIRNWHRLNKTPQSKLDWMLHTIRKENDADSRDHNRHRLSTAMASGNKSTSADAYPLTSVQGSPPSNQNKHMEDRMSLRSARSSTVSALGPEISQERSQHGTAYQTGIVGDDGFESPMIGSNFNGRVPTSTWFPQQYERVGGGADGHGRSASYGSGYGGGYSNGDYTMVDHQPHQQRSPYI